MNRIRNAAAALLVVAFAGAQPLAALAAGDQHRAPYEDRRDRDDRHARRAHWDPRWDRDDVRFDPRAHYRRDNRRYRARRLTRSDRIYRGSDSRYYCRRDDGTTGLIIGGIAGGVLGNVIAREHSKTLGTIIGAGAGAALGRAIDQGDVVCR
jgi:hypothetical protein